MAARTPLLAMTWLPLMVVLTPWVSVASFVMFSVINIFVSLIILLLDSRMLAIPRLLRTVLTPLGWIVILGGNLVVGGVLPSRRAMSVVIGKSVRILRRVHLLSFIMVILPL